MLVAEQAPFLMYTLQVLAAISVQALPNVSKNFLFLHKSDRLAIHIRRKSTRNPDQLFHVGAPCATAIPISRALDPIEFTYSTKVPLIFRKNPCISNHLFFSCPIPAGPSSIFEHRIHPADPRTVSEHHVRHDECDSSIDIGIAPAIKVL